MTLKPGSSPQAEQIKTVRRILMQLMNHSFPARMLVSTLFKNAIYIEPTYDESLFVKDLFYFEKKGYIEFPDNVLNRGRKLMDKLILLTVDGKEVAEQTMIDEAMEI